MDQILPILLPGQLRLTKSRVTRSLTPFIYYILIIYRALQSKLAGYRHWLDDNHSYDLELIEHVNESTLLQDPCFLQQIILYDTHYLGHKARSLKPLLSRTF